MKILKWLVLRSVLAACQAGGEESNSATLQANMTAYATEAAGIQQSIILDETQVVAAVIATQTHSANVSNMNNVLLATVRAGEAATPQRIAAVVDESSVADTMMEDEGGGDTNPPANSGTTVTGSTTISQVATGASIRESDGCIASPQATFNIRAERIYVTGTALNLQQGTDIRVEWRVDGQTVTQNSWTSDRNAQTLCVWFFMEQTDAAFVPGNWSATFYVDDTLSATAAFTLVDG